jgi:hypothetical protein
MVSNPVIVVVMSESREVRCVHCEEGDVGQTSSFTQLCKVSLSCCGFTINLYFLAGGGGFSVHSSSQTSAAARSCKHKHFGCCHLVVSVKWNAVSWHWNVAFLEAEDTGDHQSPGPVLIIFGLAYVVHVTIILRLPLKFEACCI